VTSAAVGEEIDVLARTALRRVASGVTVLTVCHDEMWHGTTVSAVVAISREPVVLGVCLRQRSAFTTMAERSGYFSVNVLSDAQAGLAARFADPERPMGRAQFEGLNIRACPETSAPLIGGCLAHLACEVTDRYAIGDHHMLVARVVGGCHDHAGEPLLTFGGRLFNDKGAHA
jgi:flavin reductase (DIM6/NTAB) family NADH-FMN oxidoreductase RutF